MSEIWKSIPDYEGLYEVNGIFIRDWPSAAVCARETGYSVSGIRGVVTGKKNSIFGYVFKERSDDLSLK